MIASEFLSKRLFADLQCTFKEIPQESPVLMTWTTLNTH